MEKIVDSFISVFSLITDIQLFGVPVLVWLLIPGIISIILKFINGKK